jgi:hypothetical protein
MLEVSILSRTTRCPDHVFHGLLKHHHHHDWQNRTFWAIAFLRIFRHVCPFLGIRLSAFHFFGFRKVVSLASNPQPGGAEPCIYVLPVTGWPIYIPGASLYRQIKEGSCTQTCRNRLPQNAPPDMMTHNFKQADSTRDASNLESGDLRFESRPQNRLPWLMVFLFFFSLFR